MILQNYRLGFDVIAIAFHQKETNWEFEFGNHFSKGRGVWLTTMASHRPYKSERLIQWVQHLTYQLS